MPFPNPNAMGPATGRPPWMTPGFSGGMPPLGASPGMPGLQNLYGGPQATPAAPTTMGTGHVPTVGPQNWWDYIMQPYGWPSQPAPSFPQGMPWYPQEVPWRMGSPRMLPNTTPLMPG